LLHFNRENVIVKVGIDLAEASTQPFEASTQPFYDVGIQRQPLPVLTFAKHHDASVQKINVLPTTAPHFSVAEPVPFHEQNRRPLVQRRHVPQARQLAEVRTVDPGATLLRPLNLPTRIDVDEVLALRPPKERMQHGDDVAARRSAQLDSAFPSALARPLDLEVAQLLGSSVPTEGMQWRLRILRCKLVEDPSVGIYRVPAAVTGVVYVIKSGGNRRVGAGR
jgi:hypothetical protein